MNVLIILLISFVSISSFAQSKFETLKSKYETSYGKITKQDITGNQIRAYLGRCYQATSEQPYGTLLLGTTKTTKPDSIDEGPEFPSSSIISNRMSFATAGEGNEISLNDSISYLDVLDYWYNEKAPLEMTLKNRTITSEFSKIIPKSREEIDIKIKMDVKISVRKNSNDYFYGRLSEMYTDIESGKIIEEKLEYCYFWKKLL